VLLDKCSHYLAADGSHLPCDSAFSAVSLGLDLWLGLGSGGSSKYHSLTLTLTLTLTLRSTLMRMKNMGVMEREC
jgi:hypothetical protein